MHYDKERVGRRLKSIRVDRGMSQEDLARESNVSMSSIASIETGRTGASLGTALRLTEALGCTLDDLVCRQDYHATS